MFRLPHFPHLSCQSVPYAMISALTLMVFLFSHVAPGFWLFLIAPEFPLCLPPVTHPHPPSSHSRELPAGCEHPAEREAIIRKSWARVRKSQVHKGIGRQHKENTLTILHVNVYTHLCICTYVYVDVYIYL